MKVNVQVKVHKMKKGALIPQYAKPGDAGFDLHANEGLTLFPGDSALVGTGLSIEIPPGYEMQVRPRSGLAAKYGITVLNSPGTVDSGYRGEVKVILINHGTNPYFVLRGDRIAQGVIAEVEEAQFEEAVELTESERGDGGFGHTGVGQ